MPNFSKLKNDILGTDYTLSIAYVSLKKSHEVNKKYRKKDKATNVLSFAFSKKNGELLLCKPVIRAEAKELCKTFEEWLLFLVIHGMLHLKGMEHSVRMERAEKKYSAKYNAKHNGRHRHGLGGSASHSGRVSKGEKNPKIIGVGESNSIGLRHGYITDPNSALVSLKNAIAAAEKSAEVKIKRAYVSVSGMSLRSTHMTGSAVVSKANGEVTNLDINKVLEDCEENLHLNNKKVIHVYPAAFRLDGKEVQGRLEGMRGTKLEAKALFVTYSVQHLEDLLGVVARAGVEALDVIAAPITLANIVLSDKQKIVGVALVDIGAETTSLSVFEDGSLISIHTFSIGSNDITNDIALGFKIPLDRAEMLKVGNMTDEEFPKKKLDEIIEARLCDIFESIENYLKKIKRAELLPAGIVFIGGGANTPGLIELSKSVLKLPSSIGNTELFGNSKTKLRDPTWFTALSLLFSSHTHSGYSENSFANALKDLKSMLKSGLKQLMP